MDFHVSLFFLRFPAWLRWLVMLAAMPAAQADAILDYEIVAGQGRPPQMQTAYVKDGRVLVKGFNADSDLLFDRAKQNITVISHRDRKYLTLDEKSVQQMAQQVSGMFEAVRAQMEKQMAGLSPQQRAQMEQMLSSAGLGKMLEARPAVPPSRPVLKTGAARTVSGFACQSVQMFRDDRKLGELCVAKQQALGLSTADYETLRALQSYGEKLARQAGELAARFGVQLPNFAEANLDGVPVEIVDNAPDGVRMTVKKVTNRAVDAKLFALPAGYTQAALPALPNMPPAVPWIR